MSVLQKNIVNMKIIEEAKTLMKDRFSTMIKYFIEDTQMYIEEIENSIKDRNAENAISPSHTIKSSAKQLGVERVSDIAKNIEELCRDASISSADKLKNIEPLYKILKSEFNEALTELEKLFGVS